MFDRLGIFIHVITRRIRSIRRSNRIISVILNLFQDLFIYVDFAIATVASLPRNDRIDVPTLSDVSACVTARNDII